MSCQGTTARAVPIRGGSGSLVVRLLGFVMGVVLFGCVSAGHFRQDASETYAEESESFRLDYLDSSSLEGQVAVDFIRLGGWSARAKFGAVKRKRGNWEADGIAGFGLPQASDPHIPVPLMFALVTESRFSSSTADDASSLQQLNNVFSFNFNKTGGELQIGGAQLPPDYPPAVYFDSLPLKFKYGKPQYLAYALPVDRIRLDSHEILVLKSDHSRFPGILDSATSCLILPSNPQADGSAFSGKSPWSRFQSALESYGSPSRLLDAKPSIYVSVQGFEFRIPFDEFASVTPSGTVDFCVYKLDTVDEILVLGAPFYRSTFIVHDNRESDHPRIGLSQKARSGAGLVNSQRWVYHEEVSTGMKKLELRRPSFLSESRSLENGRQGLPLAFHDGAVSDIDRPLSRFLFTENAVIMSDRVALATLSQDVYTVELSIGNPSQSGIHVIVDTGSSTLAIFLQDQPVWGYVVSGVLVVAGIFATIFCVHFVSSNFRKWFLAGVSVTDL
eukprot:ANDGO_05950.mRNA.1 hypothetical protein GUITHDRAFT_104110